MAATITALKAVPVYVNGERAGWTVRLKMYFDGQIATLESWSDPYHVATTAEELGCRLAQEQAGKGLNWLTTDALIAAARDALSQLQLDQA